VPKLALDDPRRHGLHHRLVGQGVTQAAGMHPLIDPDLACKPIQKEPGFAKCRSKCRKASGYRPPNAGLVVTTHNRPTPKGRRTHEGCRPS
jgi:hypothetical protein